MVGAARSVEEHRPHELGEPGIGSRAPQLGIDPQEDHRVRALLPCLLQPRERVGWASEGQPKSVRWFSGQCRPRRRTGTSTASPRIHADATRIGSARDDGLRCVAIRWLSFGRGMAAAIVGEATSPAFGPRFTHTSSRRAIYFGLVLCASAFSARSVQQTVRRRVIRSAADHWRRCSGRSRTDHAEQRRTQRRRGLFPIGRL